MSVSGITGLSQCQGIQGYLSVRDYKSISVSGIQGYRYLSVREYKSILVSGNTRLSQCQGVQVYLSVRGIKVYLSVRDCAADFSLLNLPKGKSLGRSKPATNS
jgi:hypothetical protein